MSWVSATSGSNLIFDLLSYYEAQSIFFVFYSEVRKYHGFLQSGGGGELERSTKLAKMQPFRVCLFRPLY
jgi:hypothetical protein